MSNKTDSTAVDDLVDGQWLEDIDAALPQAVAEATVDGRLPAKAQHLKVQVGFRELPDGHEVKFKASLTNTLLEVFEWAAQELGKPLLPPASNQPLDLLRCRERHGDGWSEPITGLDRPLWLVLVESCSRHFGIEYVLAVKINTKWAVAPSAKMTPRELLTSFGFDPSQFSLYKPDSTEPLPADTPIPLHRGERFEAQKDGKYGASVMAERPARGSQTIDDDLEGIREAGIDARLLDSNGQKYAEVKGIAVPSPPWSLDRLTLLFAIPATYPTGGLDAFYIELPVSHASGSVPYQSQTAQIDGRSWGLISWHYPTGRPWNPSHDDLSTHIEHCRGALMRRGVTQ
ncbi:MAG TPA: E2/UBC family protein [Blastocatellia bacterium]|nr:E2/UBC family protein [Blastocatellia bacterium]